MLKKIHDLQVNLNWKVYEAVRKRRELIIKGWKFFIKSLDMTIRCLVIYFVWRIFIMFWDKWDDFSFLMVGLICLEVTYTYGRLIINTVKGD